MRAHITIRCTQYTWRLKYAAAAARYKTRQQNQKVGAFECSLSACSQPLHILSATFGRLTPVRVSRVHESRLS